MGGDAEGDATTNYLMEGGSVFVDMDVDMDVDRDEGGGGCVVEFGAWEEGDED